MHFKEDSGINFGKWNDKVSYILYNIANKIIAMEIDTSDTVADYGGANSLLRNDIDCKEYYCVDIDGTKKQDKNFINESVVEHKGTYDKVIIKLVLHYLTDDEIKKMITSINAKEIIICQFVNNNEDLETKKQISIKSKESKKYLRSEKELLKLFDNSLIIAEINYICDKAFYKNRLNIDTDNKHKEKLLIIKIKG